MSDDYQMDGFSPMDDDRTVAMPPVGDASPMTMGEDAIALPGDEEKPRNTKLPWIITLSVIGALLVLGRGRSVHRALVFLRQGRARRDAGADQRGGAGPRPADRYRDARRRRFDADRCRP